MALPSSGAISLGQINNELGLAANTQISLNDKNVRALKNNSSSSPPPLTGQIDFSSLRGKGYRQGANQSAYSVASGGYRYEIYTGFSATYFTAERTIEYIICSGGGGGGNGGGGGGAGGRVETGTLNNIRYFYASAGAGGTANNGRGDGINDLSSSGNQSRIYPYSDGTFSAIEGTTQFAYEGGKGLSQNSFDSGSYGSGGAAVQNFTSYLHFGNPNTGGGRGVTYYGGGGAGDVGDGAAGNATTQRGGNGGKGHENNTWVMGTSRMIRFILGGGGGGSGWNTSAGLGGDAAVGTYFSGTPDQVTFSSASGGRWFSSSSNTYKFFGNNGQLNIDYTGDTINTAGFGGGGGAWAAFMGHGSGNPVGTDGNRGGGNGSRGVVIVRWREY
jgi:hypothetical protein